MQPASVTEPARPGRAAAAGAASDLWLWLAFFGSGVAALGDELLWTRQLGLALGGEHVGVLGVLVGFFAGMAIGALFGERWAARARDPLRLFIGLELGIGAFAVLSPWLLRAVANGLPGALAQLTGIAGDRSDPLALAVAVLVAGALLLPGTIAMGATLPVLVEAWRRARPQQLVGTGVARLYAANTAGATVGVLATVHVLLPALGLGLGALVLGGVSALAAAAAWRWRAGVPALPEQPVSPEVAAVGVACDRDPDPDVLGEPWVLAALALGTGLAAVGLEVVGVQVLAQALENTIYSFAHVLAVYLVGSAIGAWLYARVAARLVAPRPATVLLALVGACGLSVIPAGLALAATPALLERWAPAGSAMELHLWAELGVAALAFGPPTVVMGVTFAHLMALVGATGRGVGRAYAMNTLGSALAPLVFGLFVVPELGLTDGLWAVTYLYAALLVGFGWLRRFSPLVTVSSAIALVLATAAGPRALVLVEADTGWRVLQTEVTPLGVVVASELEGAPTGAPPLRRLQVGRQFRMGGVFSFGERRMGHVALLLAPLDPAQPRDVAFLGLGAGATAGALVWHPGVGRADLVELVPAVIDMLPLFSAVNFDVAKDARVTLHAADARRFVAADPRPRALVVADLFHPARDGAASLYAREHFARVRTRLEPDGVFVQWLPLHQLDDASLDLIVRTFLAEFPTAEAYLGLYNAATPALGLVGYAAGEHPMIDVGAIGRRADAPGPRGAIRDVIDLPDLLASRIADAEGLRALAGAGPVTDDLHPRIAYTAARAAYEGADDLGRRALTRLWAVRAPLPRARLTGAPTEELDRLHGEVVRRQLAIEHYLIGEALWLDAAPAEPAAVGPPPPPGPAVIEAWRAAHRAAPEFAPARGRLIAALSTALRGGSEPLVVDGVALDFAALRADVAVVSDPELAQALTMRLWQAEVDALARAGRADEAQAALARARAALAPAPAPAPVAPAPPPDAGDAGLSDVAPSGPAPR